MDIQQIYANAMAKANGLNQPITPEINHVDAPPTSSIARRIRESQVAASRTPYEQKQFEVARAAERKKQQLGLQQEENQREDAALRFAGYDEAFVQQNAARRQQLQNMDDQGRLDNFQAYKAKDPNAIPDPYLEKDLHTLSAQDLEAKYGTGAALIKQDMARNAIGLAQRGTDEIANAGQSSSWWNPLNVGGGLIKGAGNTASSTADMMLMAGGLISGDMQGAYQAMQQKGGGAALQQYGESLIGDDYKLARSRTNAQEQIDELVRDDLTQRYKGIYGSEEDARRKANAQTEDAALDRIADYDNLYMSTLEQLPELAAGGLASSATRGGVKAVTKAIAKDVLEATAESKGKKEAAKFASGSISRVLGSKEAKDKATETAELAIKKSADMPDNKVVQDLANKGKDDIANLVLKKKASDRADTVKDTLSKKAAKLHKDNAEKNAEKFATKVGNKAAALGTGTYYGGREGAGAASEAYEQIKAMDASYVANSPEGKKLKEEHPDWTNEQIKEQIAQNAGSSAFKRQGATSFASGVLLNGAESRMFGHGRATTFKGATKNTLRSGTGEGIQEYAEEYGGTYNPRAAINAALGMEHFNTKTGDDTYKAHARGVQGAVTAFGTTGITNSHELIPTGAKGAVSKIKDAVQKPVDKQQQETIKPMMTKPDGSDTNFGSTVKDISKDILETTNAKDDPKLAKALKEGDFVTINSHISKIAEAAQKRLDSGKSTDVETDKARVEYYEKFKEIAGDAIKQDIAETAAETYRRKNELFTSLVTRIQDIKSKIDTDEYKGVKVLDENGEINEEATTENIINKFLKDDNDLYEALSEADERNNQLDAFLESPMGQTLLNQTKKVEQVQQSSQDDVNIGSTGTKGKTVVQGLASVKKHIETKAQELKDLDPESDEYKTKVANFEQEVNKAIQSFDTRGSLEPSEAKQAWADVSSYLGSIRDIMKAHNVSPQTTGLLTQLHTAISQMQQAVAAEDNKISNNQAKVLFDKFIGSKGKKGLLTYVQEAMRNDGKLSAKSQLQLSHFLTTQMSKKLSFDVAKQVVDMNKGKPLNLSVKNTMLKLSDKGLKMEDGTPNHFKTRNEFNAYYDALSTETDIFNTLAQSLLESSNPSFAVKVKPTKSETKSQPKVAPKAEPKTEAKVESKVESKVENKAENKAQEKPAEKAPEKQSKPTSEKVEPITPTKEDKATDSATESFEDVFGSEENAPKQEAKSNGKTLNVSSKETGLGRQLSNLYPNTVSVFGLEFPSVEHAIGYIKGKIYLAFSDVADEDGLLDHYLKKNAKYDRLDTAIAKQHKDPKSHVPLDVLGNKAEAIVEFLVEQMLLQNPRLLSKLQSQVARGTTITHKFGNKSGSYEKAISAVITKFLVKNEDGSYTKPEADVLNLNSKVTKKDLEEVYPEIAEMISADLEQMEEDESFFVDDYIKLDDVVDNWIKSVGGKEVEERIQALESKNTDTTKSEDTKESNKETSSDVPLAEQKREEQSSEPVQAYDSIEDAFNAAMNANTEESYAEAYEAYQAMQPPVMDDVPVEAYEDTYNDDGSYIDTDAEMYEELVSDEIVEGSTQDNLANSQPMVKDYLKRLLAKGGFKISHKLKAFWRSIGLSYEDNVFDPKRTKYKQRRFISGEAIKAAREGSKGALFNLVGVDHDTYNSWNTNEQVVGEQFLSGWTNISSHFANYFKKPMKSFGLFKYDKLSKLQVELAPTALINFAKGITEDGRLVLGEDFIQAMTHASIKTVQELTNKSTKRDQVIEQLSSVHNLEDIQVIQMTPVRQAMNSEQWKNHVGEKDSDQNKGIAPMSLVSAADKLGTNLNTFVEHMGKAALRELGIHLHPEDKRVEDALVYALGMEIYGAMLEMGVLSVKRVQYFDNDKPTAHIDHVNFAWNTYYDNLGLHPEERYHLNRSVIQNKNRNSEQVSYVRNDRALSRLARSNTHGKAISGISAYTAVMSGMQSEAAERMYPEQAKSYNGVKTSGLEVTNENGETVIKESKPFKVSQDDVQSELTSGSNSKAQSYVQALNNIPYKVNTGFFDLVTKGLGDIALIAFGFKDENSVIGSDRTKDAVRSRNSQIQRSMSILDHFLGRADEQGALDKVRYFIKHKLMSNTRIQVDGDLNPQADKIIREMIFGETTYSDPDNKFRPNTDIQSWFKNLHQSDDVHEVGYGLALAQTLGVKIERVYDTKAFEAVSKILAEEDHPFNEMVKVIQETQETGSPPKGSQEIATKFHQKFGNGAPRALHAAMTVANFQKAASTGTEFKSNLMIEADGIGNGVHNSLRQFSIAFTPAYIQSMKRTGVVTMDFLAQARQAADKDKALQELKKQGARANFDTSNSNDVLDDVYQSVSNQVGKQVKANIQSIAKAIQNKEFDWLNSYELDREKEPTNAPIRTIDDLLFNNNLRSIVWFELSAGRFESPEQRETHLQEHGISESTYENLKQLYVNALTIKLMDEIGARDTKNLDDKTAVSSMLLNEMSSDAVANIAMNVTRNFAKAGVTPANYGGKLEGIANQLSSDLTSVMDKLADQIIKEVHEGTDVKHSGSGEKIRQFADLFFLDVPYQTKENGEVRNMDSVELANSFANTFAGSARVHGLLKKTLATQMQNAIDVVYGEQFALIDMAISMDNVLFNEFVNEYEASYQERLKQRNIENGWATYNDKGTMIVKDEKAYDPLSKKDVKDVLANLKSSPTIATAMSNNDQLINQLFNTGNSLIKTGISQSQDEMRAIYTSSVNSEAIVVKEHKGSQKVFQEQLSITMRDAWRSFDPAGAAALVQSVVATESSTQGELAVQLAKEGLLVQNVFDGAEMPPHLRELIGNKINQITNAIHQNHSLMEAFFHKLNRSGLPDKISSFSVEGNPTIDDIFAITSKTKGYKHLISVTQEGVERIEITTSMLLADALQRKAAVTVDNAFDRKDLVYRPDGTIDVDATIRKKLDKINKEIEAIKRTRKIAEKLRNGLKAGVEKVELTRYDIDALQKFGYDVIGLEDLWNKTINNFANAAARSRAMKHIEKTMIPAIINQFGGVSGGFEHLKDSKVAERMVEQFAEFATSRGIDITNFALRTEQGSKLLSDFLRTNPEIVAEAKKQIAKWKDKLAPNTIGVTLSNNIRTVGDFLDSIASFNNKTLEHTTKALVKPIEKLIGRDTKIYTNRAEYEAVIGQSTEDHSGFYVPTFDENGNVVHNIFANPSVNAVNPTIVLHEILHGIQTGVFDDYIKDPSNLDPEIKQAMDGLKKIAVEISSYYLNNPEVQEMLNQAQQNGLDINANYQSNILFAQMANIQHLFGSKESDLVAQYGEQQLAQLRSNALKEFYAYGLTQPELLNDMRYKGVRGRKGLLGLLDKIINLFKSMRNEVAKAFGYTNGKEAPTSALIDSLALINAISARRTNPEVNYKINVNNLNVLQGNAAVKVKPQNELLFQVAGLTNQDTDKPATEVFKDIVDTSPNMSKEHGEHLQDLFDTVNNAITRERPKRLAANYAQAWADIKDNDLAQNANQIVSDLAQAGITMNDAEKSAFKLMYAVNQAGLDNNSQLLLEAEKVMQGMLQNINPADFLHNGAFVYDGTDKFNAVFNNKTEPSKQLAMVMALAQTNQEMRDYLNQAVNNTGSVKGIKKFNKKLADAFQKVTLYSDVNKNIENFKGKPVMDKLGLVAANLEFTNNAGRVAREEAKDALLAEQQKQLDALEWVEKVGDGISNKKLSKLIKSAGEFVLIGKGLDANDNDSTFREMVQDIINNAEFLAQRPTLYSQIWRWFAGAFKLTQYAYKLRSKHAVMSDAVREKVGNAITQLLEKEFSNLQPEDRRAIHKAVLSIGLHKLDGLKGHLQVNVADIMANQSKYNAEIKAFEQELSKQIDTMFPNMNQRHKNQINNYLNWQVQGLGELMVKGIAKGAKNTTHGILPNARAIAAMPQLKALMYIPNMDSQAQEDLTNLVQGLAVLHSIKYLNQADKDNLVKLYKTQAKAMKELMVELRDMDSNAARVDPDSLMGYDGYIHNKRNPNHQIKIVNAPSEEEHQKLEFLGWKLETKLPNGESVYVTKNSLHNNWTAGSFGTSELSVFGANSVTGQSLRSTGTMVDAKMQLGSELQQRLQKVMDTPNYYDKLEEYSHYRPIINRNGFITGYEVDVSNDQRDSYIESAENDLAAVGNYQARLVEEGITAKQNIENINILNQEYNKARDKRVFVKIDGKAKPKSNSNADVQYAKRLNDFYYTLPAETRAYIENQDGLYVHRHEVDNLIGYYQASSANLFTGNSSLPEPVVKAYVGFMREFFKFFGVKSPAVLMRQAGRLSGEMASLTKDFILNRSMIVPAQNMLSNVLQLVTAGVPVNKVIPLMMEGYRNAKMFTDNQSRIIQLEHELATRQFNNAEKAKRRAEITALKNANSKNPAKVLVENGILTSVTDLSISNDQEDADFTMLHKAGQKFGVNTLQSKTPNFIKNVLVQDGTKWHAAMEQLMDYGDFVAKYALYKHMTEVRAMDSEHAINVIRDEFVDYAMNRGAMFDWANKVGLTWFLSYKLAIQKIFFRNLRRNFLRTAAVWSSAKAAANVVSDVPIVNQIVGDTVMDQFYPLKPTLYHYTPHHTDIVDAHWIEKVLEAF